MMHNKTLERIHARVNILNLINNVEVEQMKLEMAHAAIDSDISQEIGHVAYEYHDELEDIELRMSMLDEEYYALQNSLWSLGEY
jgi:hypothetical protein